MLKRITISLCILLVISLGVGFIFQSLIGFWQGVTASIILHFLVFYFFNIKNDIPLSEDVEQQAFNNLLQTQTVNVNCPCGQSPITVPILLNSDNIFTCEKCVSKFRVNVAFESVLLTEPLNIANAFEALKIKGTTL